MCTRNNADVVGENLRFHKAQGVDAFVVTDNLSTDSTVDIVEDFGRSSELSLIHEPRDDCNGWEWVTRMARQAFDMGADWVIHTDADEFWWPESGTIRELIESISPETNCLVVPRVNFLPPRAEGLPFWSSQIVREAQSFNAVGQPLPPKVMHRTHPDAVVAQGNHSVSGFEVRSRSADDFIIFHFPLRSYSQFEDKIRLGGAALERNETLPKHLAGTWRMLYEEYKKGNLPEFYAKECLTEEEVACRLADGRLLIDTRLKDFFAKHLS